VGDEISLLNGPQNRPPIIALQIRRDRPESAGQPLGGQGNTAATIFADKCLRNRKKKVVQLEKPATPKKDWARIAAEDRYVSKGCGPERCAEALIEITIYRLGISTVECLSDDDIRKNILQMEVQIKITEKEVETLVPRYEI
jgi:hypothetical protein